MAEASSRSLVLASGSAARRRMLEAAGIDFTVAPTTVDETAIRKAMRVDDPRTSWALVAQALAAAKALDVSRRVPAALVIGADQVLSASGQLYEKAPDFESARRVLEQLRGRTHELHSAVVLAEGGRVVWHHGDTALLTMRPFSSDFLDDYLHQAGKDILASVGCYQIEGCGLQLFDCIAGDYFTILGMPLLPLLGELRQRKFLRW